MPGTYLYRIEVIKVSLQDVNVLPLQLGVHLLLGSLGVSDKPNDNVVCIGG